MISFLPACRTLLVKCNAAYSAWHPCFHSIQRQNYVMTDDARLHLLGMKYFLYTIIQSSLKLVQLVPFWVHIATKLISLTKHVGNINPLRTGIIAVETQLFLMALVFACHLPEVGIVGMAIVAPVFCEELGRVRNKARRRHLLKTYLLRIYKNEYLLVHPHSLTDPRGI